MKLKLNTLNHDWYKKGSYIRGFFTWNAARRKKTSNISGKYGPTRPGTDGNNTVTMVTPVINTGMLVSTCGFTQTARSVAHNNLVIS